MAYTVKTTGSLSFKPIELECPSCGYEEDQSIDLRDCKTEEERDAKLNSDFVCPNCGTIMEKVWRSAPSIGSYTNPRSDKTIAAKKKSYHKRFLKKEADEVRHKHGVNYDDSLRSAAAQRIKKEIK